MIACQGGSIGSMVSMRRVAVVGAGFVGAGAVVAHRLLSFWREVEQRGGDEVGGLEDLEVALGGVVALGAVDDGLGGGVPGDFLEEEGMAEEIFGEALAPGAVVGGDGLFAAVVVGKWRARIVFVRTISMRGKIGGAGSLYLIV